MSASQRKAPLLFIPHGGGPLPLLNDDAHRQLIGFLTRLTQGWVKPAAIIVVSAHWEAPLATITAAPQPQLIYDYSGFPEQAYRIRYPATGAPELAQRLRGLLLDQGIEAQLDQRRGFDHGLFVPLKLMFPAADIPCLQISLLQGLQPQAHIALGKALSSLRQHNICIIGSGFSFHNMSAFFVPDQQSDARNAAFQDWIIAACCDSELSAIQREQQLLAWRTAPFAEFCHPRAEHLMPLHVCLGAAEGAAAELVFDELVLGKRCCGLVWY
jgi:4,5-DOPA dioxygenase extradiol